jgi:hypothetical protein
MFAPPDPCAPAADLPELLALKSRELDLLHELVGLEPGAGLGSMLEIPHRKLMLRRALWRNLAAWDAPETNLSDQFEGHLFGRRVTWGYQRFDQQITGGDFADHLYGISFPAGAATRSVLATCGMAAISACLMALKLEVGELRLLFQRDGYFETVWFAKRYVGLSQDPNHPAALYLDTISRERATDRLARIDPDACKAVLVDTTCVRDDDPDLQRLVDAACDAGVPIFLLRSHMKLDFAGVELTRLGSLVAVGSGRAGELATRVCGRANDYLVRTGGIPSLITLPSFFGDNRFRQAARERISRVQATNAAVADLVAASARGLLVRFAHRCFFTFEAAEEAALRPLIDGLSDLEARFTATGIPAYRSPSFGFDFTSLGTYHAHVRNLHVIRIAMCELPASHIETAAQVIVDWIEHHA